MYPNEIYIKADRILEKRREKAINDAEMRSIEIKGKIPEISVIQHDLAQIGLEISQLFLFKGDFDSKLAELKNKSKALIEKRGAVLKANGYAEDALKPQFACPACEDKGFIQGRSCACRKQVLKDLMREEVSNFAPLNKCTFDSFKLDYYSSEPLENGVVPRLRAEKILEASRTYAQNFSKNSKSILFIGSTGLGKTHLSLAIANVAINRGYSVCYGTSHNICEDLKSESFGRYDNLSYTKNQILNCDLLILDDLGTEVNNQYNVAEIYNIINTRILRQKPTVISTNYEHDELLEKYDQRITSRIMGEEYIRMLFFGTDIRNL